MIAAEGMREGDRRLVIYARLDDFSPNIKLLIGKIDWQGRIFERVNAITLEPSTEGDLIEPTMRLKREVAQQLMDQLWDCGLRPTEGTGSAGALAATQKHLDDMRTLVFQKP